MNTSFFFSGLAIVDCPTFIRMFDFQYLPIARVKSGASVMAVSIGHAWQYCYNNRKFLIQKH